MGNSTAISKTAGRVGSLLAVLGVVAFFLGIFGIFGSPRSFAFAGVAMMITSMVGFFIEEQGSRG